MPYKSVGKVIYKKVNGKWVVDGHSKDATTAKAAIRARYANTKEYMRSGKK